MEDVVHEPQMTSGTGGPPTGVSPGGSAVGRIRSSRRSRSRVYGSALAVGLGALAFVGTPTAALAADECPNADVRAQQQVQHLPNCLAYEKVTPNNKGGAFPGVTGIRSDGGAVLVDMKSPIADLPIESFMEGKYLALRDQAMWNTTALMPAFDLGRVPNVSDAFGSPRRASADFSRVLFYGQYPLHPNDKGVSTANNSYGNGSNDGYIREPDGTFTWLVANPDVVDTSLETVSPIQGDSTLDRVLLVTKRQFAADRPVGPSRIFRWDRNGTMRVISDLPGGEANTADVIAQDGWASEDLSRAAFTMGTDASKRAYVRFVAEDENASYTQALVGPDGLPCAWAEPVKMSSDGAKLLFTCQRRSNDTTVTQTGLYLRDLTGSPAAVTVLADGADLPDPSFVQSLFGGASEDLSIIWGANQAFTRLQYWRSGEAPRPVGPELDLRNMKYEFTSPNGKYFAMVPKEFPLPVPNIPVSGVQPGDRPQAFLAAVETNDIACVSCLPDGSVTPGEAFLYKSDDVLLGIPVGRDVSTPLSDRGSLVFTTRTSLSERDSNGKADAYLWDNGRATLLTSGTNPQDSFAWGGSTDGSTAVFATADTLMSNDRDGGQFDIYAARIAGGTLLPSTTDACEANCRDAAGERPAAPQVATSVNLGNGNVPDAGDADGAPRASVRLTASARVSGTSTTVRVRTSGAGTVRVAGNGLRTSSVTVKKAGTHRVTVRLSTYGKQRQRKGRLATRVKVRFAPAAGSAVNTSKAVTFVRSAKKGGR